MHYLKPVIHLIITLCATSSLAQINMVDSLKELFIEVQLQGVFNDSKTFPDAIPKQSMDSILLEFRNLPAQNKDLKEFVQKNFELPQYIGTPYTTDSTHSISEHLNHLWPYLTRQPDTIKNSTLIPLPFPYIVPGGRFREIYYWDSYFTMLGLQVSGRKELIKNMVDNFAYLINTYNHIPNGNRTYYLSRSQPPYFSLMIQLLSEETGKDVLTDYLPALEKEYLFWMDGANTLTKDCTQYRRVVRMPGGHILNRYYDDLPYPRPEAFKEDVLIALNSSKNKDEVFRNLRAGAESGWDFSSRWFADSSLASIRTTDIIPVDLNSLLHHLELTLAKGYKMEGDLIKETMYMARAKARKEAINKYLYCQKQGFYFDYDLTNNLPTYQKTLAGAYPLFFDLADKKQAEKVKVTLESQFLKTGGFVCTLVNSGEQWDWPNGWPPLQWITCKGLLNYGYSSLAQKAMQRWVILNKKVFEATGKMMEKYNVVDISVKAGGGEYPLQDGFGWTNGVYLKMVSELKEIKAVETK
ncbi:MAG TPA: alpha,alpha-trehalase TreF [Cytophagaceae bacterium]